MKWNFATWTTQCSVNSKYAVNVLKCTNSVTNDWVIVFRRGHCLEILEILKTVLKCPEWWNVRHRSVTVGNSHHLQVLTDVSFLHTTQYTKGHLPLTNAILSDLLGRSNCSIVLDRTMQNQSTLKVIAITVLYYLVATSASSSIERNHCKLLLTLNVGF